MNVQRSALQLDSVDGHARAERGHGGEVLAAVQKYLRAGHAWIRREMALCGITGIIMAVAFVILTDAALLTMRYIHALPPVALTFLIPVVVAAMRWGTLSGAVTALGGAVTVTVVFYNSYNLPEVRSQFLGVAVFLSVSFVLGYLAAKTRRDEARALKRENEVRGLYAFLQQISETNSPASIFEAMQQHLGILVGRNVRLFDSLGALGVKLEELDDVEVPRAVTDAVTKHPPSGADVSIFVDNERGNTWLVRPVSMNTADFGVIAVDLGRRDEFFDDLRARVVAVISDAGLSLERLGLARTIAEARTRAETEQFRRALIGSVSHELRTPLSSILGASTVLSLAPELTSNSRLKNLAELIHEESERLDVEILNVLDASRISSNGLQTRLEWVEPADFIDAALQRCRNRLANRTVEVTLPEELVLLRIDSVLMERALAQIVDNAAKYSPPDTPIMVCGYRGGGQMIIRVSDQGAGLNAEDRALLGQKFFRGNRHAQVSAGLGLGFWIAGAFVAANNGTLETFSEGVNKGMTVTIRLPLPMNEIADEDE